MAGTRAAAAMILLAVAGDAAADAAAFDEFIEWLPGRWDNGAQVADDRASGVDPFDRHRSAALDIERVDAEAIAGALFVFRQDDDGNAQARVTLERFAPSPVTTEIIQERLVPADAAVQEALLNGAGGLRDLRERDLRVTRECRVYWRRVDDHYEGRTRTGRCREVPADATQNSAAQVLNAFRALYQERLIWHDVYRDGQGAVVPRPGGRTPVVYRK